MTVIESVVGSCKYGGTRNAGGAEDVTGRSCSGSFVCTVGELADWDAANDWNNIGIRAARRITKANRCLGDDISDSVDVPVERLVLIA
jgi:hypothetical protein